MMSDDFTPLYSLLDREPYSVPQSEKEPILLQGLNQLTKRNYENCLPYKNIINGIWKKQISCSFIDEVPYLPVSIFKSVELASVPKDDLKLTLTSSGTTGQVVSKIYVDSVTSNRQQRGLSSSLRHALGPKRLPMLVIDSSAVFKNPQMMSARGAGVLGIMRYGRDHVFALDENLEPNYDQVQTFLEKNKGQPFFMFGFTFMVWLQFFERFKHLQLDLSNATLVHSGGWKKMIDRSVNPKHFNDSFYEVFGLNNIFNFYGMVEQIGSIFMEGENGLLYPPNFSDVIIRDPNTWEALPVGETGVIQVLSLLPGSYPGHSLLTEDMGRIETIDADLQGKGLRIIGRVPKAELRGCSDVIGEKHQ